MKLTRQSVIAATCLIVGGFIGASALVALAQTWTPAPGIPTTCPAGYPGCDAPINVGSSTQTKLGSLILNAALQNQNAFGLTVFGTSILNGTVQINSGSPVWGKVLMANDSSGTGVWVATSSLGITGGGGGGLQFAQAFREGSTTNNDTGTNALVRPIYVISGPASAFVALNNVTPASPSYFSRNSSTYNYVGTTDGVACATGWQMTGCWESSDGDAPNDLYPYNNGCTTNDWDQYTGVNTNYGPVDISIMCVRAQ